MHPQALNCIVVPCEDAATQGRLSFMGASIECGEFRQYIDSPDVDLNREYEYPPRYKCLSGLGVALAAIFWWLYVFGQYSPELAYLLGLIFVIGGLTYCSVHCCFYARKPANTSQPLSRREFRHVVGTTGCTAASWWYFLAGLIMHALMDFLMKTGIFYVFGYLCISATSLLYVGGMMLVTKTRWFGVKVPIKCGWVFSMLWLGGLFAILVAGILNTYELTFLWPNLDMTCNIANEMGLGPDGAQTKNRTDRGCMIFRWIQWTLTAGVNEEVLKFAVLARIRSSVHDVVNSRCLTRCLRSSNTPGVPCCAWYLKLATSPWAVVLAGMASGAGFASMENINYVSKIQAAFRGCQARGDMQSCVDQGVTWWTAAVRMRTASIHICMSGTPAVAMAYEQFIDPSEWRLKWFALLGVIVAHGTHNASPQWGNPRITLLIVIFINLQFFYWVVLLFLVEREKRGIDEWRQARLRAIAAAQQPVTSDVQLERIPSDPSVQPGDQA